MNNKRQLRVTWISNATWSPSGYSQQTYDIERLFIKSGWDGSNFALINMFGHGGQPFKDALGIINYPSMNHTFGSDALLHHGRHFQSDVTFTLLDIWPQNPTDWQQANRIIPFVPIDYDPVPVPILQNLRFANRIIAMSKFGQKQLKDNGFSSVYIPHHVDMNIFKPLDKKKTKQNRGINPELFVFGMVGANKDIFPRKSFQQVLDAFARFLTIHPKSLLYIHTNPNQPGGFPVQQYANFLNIGNNVVYPDLYRWQFTITKEEMNDIYNTFDVLLSPSSSEGFNIPVIEGQACGVPVIVNNWTSMPELIIDGMTGWMTKIGCKHFMPIGSYMAWPDTNNLYDKMELAFSSNIEEKGRNAHAWIKENFAMERIWSEKWLPFLLKVQDEIYPQIPLLTEQTKKA